MARKSKMREGNCSRQKWRVASCVYCGVYLKTKQRRYTGNVCAGAMCRTCSGQPAIKKRPGFLASAKIKLLTLLNNNWGSSRYFVGNLRERKVCSDDDSERSIIDKQLVEIDVYYLGGAHTSMEIFDGCTIHELSQSLYPGLNVGLYEVKVDINEPLGHQLLPSEMTIRNLLKRRERLGWTQAKVVVPLYRQGGPPHSLMHTPEPCQTVIRSVENQTLHVLDQIKELTQFDSTGNIRIPSPPALTCIDTNTTPRLLRLTDSPDADDSDWESTGSAIRDTNDSPQADLSFITHTYPYSSDTSDSDNPPTGPTTTKYAASKKRARNVLNDSCASFSLDWCNTVATNTDFVASRSQGTMVDTVMTNPRMCAAATNTDDLELYEPGKVRGQSSPGTKVRQSVDSANNTDVCIVRANADMCDAYTSTNEMELDEKEEKNVRFNTNTSSATNTDTKQCREMETNTDACVVRLVTDMCDTYTSTDTRIYADTTTNTTHPELSDSNTNTDNRTYVNVSTNTDTCVVRTIAEMCDTGSNTDTRLSAEITTNTEPCTVRTQTELCDSSTDMVADTRQYTDTSTNTDISGTVTDPSHEAAGAKLPHLPTRCASCGVRSSRLHATLPPPPPPLLLPSPHGGTIVDSTGASAPVVGIVLAATDIAECTGTMADANGSVAITLCAEGPVVPASVLPITCTDQTVAPTHTLCTSNNDTSVQLNKVDEIDEAPEWSTSSGTLTAMDKNLDTRSDINSDTADTTISCAVAVAISGNTSATTHKSTSEVTKYADASCTKLSTSAAAATTTGAGRGIGAGVNDTAASSPTDSSTTATLAADNASATALTRVNTHYMTNSATSPISVDTTAAVHNSISSEVTAYNDHAHSAAIDTVATDSSGSNSTSCTTSAATTSVSATRAVANLNSNNSSSNCSINNNSNTHSSSNSSNGCRTSSTANLAAKTHSVSTTACAHSKPLGATTTATTKCVDTTAFAHSNAHCSATSTAGMRCASTTTSSNNSTNCSAFTAASTYNTNQSLGTAYNTARVVNYTTAWKMPQEDVNLVSRAKQWLSWALHVNGTANHLTWLQRPPWQVTELSVPDTFGAFVCTPCELSNGTVLRPMCMSSFAIQLGCCYKWTGTNLVPDTFSSCDASSVKMTNSSNQAWTFGLTKMDPKTQQQQPICADMVLQKQPVTYTPILTMYAKVGRTYKTSSVVADIGSWVKFDITRVNSTYQYDHSTSAWIAAL